MKTIVKNNLSMLKGELLPLFAAVQEEYENLYQTVFGAVDQPKWDINESVKIHKMHQKIFKQSIYFFAAYNMYGAELRSSIAYLLINLEIKRISDYAGNLINYYKKAPRSPQKTPQVRSYWKKILVHFAAVGEEINKPDIAKLKLLINQIKTTNFDKIFPELESEDLLKELPAREIYYFFMQFRFLERTADRLINICEYLVFLKSFDTFRTYEKQKLNS